MLGNLIGWLWDFIKPQKGPALTFAITFFCTFMAWGLARIFFIDRVMGWGNYADDDEEEQAKAGTSDIALLKAMEENAYLRGKLSNHEGKKE
jgi:hypothetical protein